MYLIPSRRVVSSLGVASQRSEIIDLDDEPSEQQLAGLRAAAAAAKKKREDWVPEEQKKRKDDLGQPKRDQANAAYAAKKKTPKVFSNSNLKFS